MWCLSLSGLRWAKKTGIFILGTLTLMTVGFTLIVNLLKETLRPFQTKFTTNIVLCFKVTELPLLDLFINPKKKGLLNAQEKKMKKLIISYFQNMTNETYNKVRIV